MSGNEVFELESGTGWSRGLDNMLRSGLARWFKTKTWWIQCLIWGGLAAIFVSPSIFLKEPPRLMDLLMISFIFIGLFPAVGVIIIMQDAIVGEKREGTAAWVLSKPLTRSSFVLSKVIANCVGILVTMIVVPFCISFAILSIGHKSSFFSLGFVGDHGGDIHQSLFLSLDDFDAGHIFQQPGTGYRNSPGSFILTAEYPLFSAFLALCAALEPGCTPGKHKPSGDISRHGNPGAIVSHDFAAGYCAREYFIYFDQHLALQSRRVLKLEWIALRQSKPAFNEAGLLY